MPDSYNVYLDESCHLENDSINVGAIEGPQWGHFSEKTIVSRGISKGKGPNRDQKGAINGAKTCC